ncbi:MAG: hypothetical protein AAFR16_08905 [Pseudomonadota bacterium]
MAAPEPLSPREFFTALFETVLEEVERNPDFAEKLAHRLGQQVAYTTRARRGPAEAPEALMTLDLRAARAELGETGLREMLSGFRNAELAALIRARKLSDGGALSRRPKNSLLNVILRAAR